MASLLEALGNVIGLPGSMVLDSLSLNNPFDQLLDPLGGSGRMSGSDTLKAWGAKEDHPLLGLGLELATDPMAYMGAGAISKGVKGAGWAASAANKFRGAKAAMKNPDAFRKAMGGVFRNSADDGFKAAPNRLAPNQPYSNFMGAPTVRDAPPSLVQALGGVMPPTLKQRAVNALFDPNYRQMAKGAGIFAALDEARAGREPVMNDTMYSQGGY